jgi:thiamine biosynthesis lipoprotein
VDKLVEATLSFHAMNTNIEVIACTFSRQMNDAERALRRVKETFITLERTLSRFDPDSELSKLNVSSGSAFKASGVLFNIVKMALDASSATKGIFDPTVLPALIDAGYERSFEELAPQRKTSPARVMSKHQRNWRNIFMDPASSTINLPLGVSLDLGGIGKGWAVDHACQYLTLFPGYAIDAGGDIRVGGKQAAGIPWMIGVDDPFLEGHDLTVLQLNEGAICTSTKTRRKWKLANSWKHHLIDPRTMRPAESPVAEVTIAAESAARAEIIAKTALILGPDAGLQFIRSQPHTKGLLVIEDGRLIYSDGFWEADGGT